MREIEINTARNWLKTGAIRIVSEGEENTYYIDKFDAEFFCKNYPDAPYREWCRDRKGECRTLGYCPRDPNCGN